MLPASRTHRFQHKTESPREGGGGLNSFSLAKIANLFIYEYDLLIDIWP